MIGTAFASLVRFYSATNSATFPDADIVLIANAQKDEIARKLLKASEKVFLTPQTTDLVSSTITREYPMPSNINMSKIKKVEAKFDGTNWVQLFEIDQAYFQHPTSETDILSRFNNEQFHQINNKQGARYELMRRSIWIFSGTISAVDEGLKAWTEEYPADITTGSLALATDLSLDPSETTYGLPKDFHEIWARMTSRAWKQSKEKPIPLSENEMKIEIDLRELVASYTPASLDRDDFLGEPSSEDTYNNGFDL